MDILDTHPSLHLENPNRVETCPFDWHVKRPIFLVRSVGLIRNPSIFERGYSNPLRSNKIKNHSFPVHYFLVCEEGNKNMPLDIPCAKQLIRCLDPSYFYCCQRSDWKRHQAEACGNRNQSILPGRLRSFLVTYKSIRGTSQAEMLCGPVNFFDKRAFIMEKGESSIFCETHPCPHLLLPPSIQGFRGKMNFPLIKKPFRL